MRVGWLPASGARMDPLKPTRDMLMVRANGKFQRMCGNSSGASKRPDMPKDTRDTFTALVTGPRVVALASWNGPVYSLLYMTLMMTVVLLPGT